MESSNTILNKFTDVPVFLPVAEVAIFVTFVSVCMFLGRQQLGLLGTYAFVFYWGFLNNSGNFFDDAGDLTWTIYLYSISGFLMACATLVSMIRKDFHDIQSKYPT